MMKLPRDWNRRICDMVADMYIHREQGMENNYYYKLKMQLEQLYLLGYDHTPFRSIVDGYFPSFAKPSEKRYYEWIQKESNQLSKATHLLYVGPLKEGGSSST